MAHTQTFQDFEILKDFVRADSRGRIVLGEALGERQFQLLKNENGDLLLRPVVAIPQHEAWLYKNSEALNSVRRGLNEARERKFSKKGPDLKAGAKLASKLEDD